MTNGNDKAFTGTRDDGEMYSQGLTKREMISAMALQGLLSSMGTGHNVMDYNELASDAVMATDALINALNQPLK